MGYVQYVKHISGQEIYSKLTISYQNVSAGKILMRISNYYTPIVTIKRPELMEAKNLEPRKVAIPRKTRMVLMTRVR